MCSPNVLLVRRQLVEQQVQATVILLQPCYADSFKSQNNLSMICLIFKFTLGKSLAVRTGWVRWLEYYHFWGKPAIADFLKEKCFPPPSEILRQVLWSYPGYSPVAAKENRLSLVTCRSEILLGWINWMPSVMHSGTSGGEIHEKRQHL